MVLPAGFANWMVLFQIKKQKQKNETRKRTNYILMGTKAHKSPTGSHLDGSQLLPHHPFR